MFNSWTMFNARASARARAVFLGSWVRKKPALFWRGRLCVNLLKFFEKFGLGFSDWDLFSRFFLPVFFHDDLTTGFPGFSVFVVRK
jgi:hypothetical protein